MLIQPTPNPPSLQLIVKPPRKGFVFVAIADEARIELDRLSNKRACVGDKVFRNPAAPEKNLGIPPLPSYNRMSPIELN
jgi:hypothetical protein